MSPVVAHLWPAGHGVEAVMAVRVGGQYEPAGQMVQLDWPVLA